MLAVSLVYDFLLITIAQSAALGGQQTTTALVAYGLFAAAEHVFLLAPPLLLPLGLILGWVADLIWEHGKRNYALYLADLMRIVCPVGDGSGTTGVGIFDADPDEVDRIMRQDPGVKAGLFTYELHAIQTFPESRLTSASPAT